MPTQTAGGASRNIGTGGMGLAAEYASGTRLFGRRTLLALSTSVADRAAHQTDETVFAARAAAQSSFGDGWAALLSTLLAWVLQEEEGQALLRSLLPPSEPGQQAGAGLPSFDGAMGNRRARGAGSCLDQMLKFAPMGWTPFFLVEPQT